MAFQHFRYVILAIATLCCTSIMSNMNIYNSTKICANPIDQDLSSGNYTEMSANFTRGQESMLSGAPAVGALIFSVPYMIAFNRLPCRYVFFSAGIISIVSTALAPLAFSLGFWGFLVARACQGISFSTLFQVFGLVTAEWAGLGEHGLFLAFMTASTQLSSMFTMPVSGALCSSNTLGWPWVFYVNAIVGAVLFVLWLLIYRDSPAKHASMTEQELKKIVEGKVEKKERETVPYRPILKDVSIWAVWLAAFANKLGVQLITQYEPVYFKDYLNYNIFSSGILSAVPIFAQFGAKLLAGISSDALSCISPTVNSKMFNTVALIVSGILMIGLAFIPKDQQILCVIGITLAVASTGFNTAGYVKCTTLRSRQHAHFPMTQIMNIWAICILIDPFIVEAILVDHTSQTQWLIVLAIHGGFAIIAGVFYIFTADASPAPWTHSPDEKPILPWKDIDSVSTFKLEDETEEGKDYNYRL